MLPAGRRPPSVFSARPRQRAYPPPTQTIHTLLSLFRLTATQNLLQLAALFNRPEIACAFLESLDAAADQQAEQQRLSARRESVSHKTTDNSSARIAALGRELDQTERLFHMKCEAQLLTALSATDAAGRTSMHYAAASNGVMVGTLLHFRSTRFRDARTYKGAHPVQPLFPAGGWVSPQSGQLWLPGVGTGAAAAGAPGEEGDGAAPPPGFVSVEELLKARREPTFIDAKCSNNGTPLHYATAAGDARAIRALLEFGAETFSVTKQGATPLDLSSSRVCRRTLVPVENAVQLSCGMPMQRPGVKAPLAPSASSVGFSRTAVGSGGGGGGGGFGADGASTVAQRKSAAESALTFIVGSGEDVNGRTGIKLQAPLHVAATQGAVDIVQLLLASGARVDVRDVNGCTAMHLAAELGTERHMAVVRLLFEAGADVNASNCLQKSPLHLAAVGGPHFEPGHRLLPGGAGAAEVSEAAAAAAAAAEEGGEGAAAQHQAAAHSGPGSTADGNHAVIVLLAKLGANLEAVDLEGNTPLIAAARRGNHLGVETLLNLNARCYAQNIRGHTALHVAAFAKQLPCVHQLARWDAEVGKLKFVLDSSGRSAYDLSADPPTREALHTLWEGCASGRLDLVQSVHRQTSLLPPDASAPWLPVRLWETTRVLKRTPLHCAVTGAAKAMAMLRAEIAAAEAAGERGAAAKEAALGGGVGHGGVQEALAKAGEQRRERESNPNALKGTGLPRHRPSPSAVHIVAGLGLRFITGADGAGAPPPQLPPPAYNAWGGHHSDVLLTFPEALDPLAVRQTVDRNAFVPKAGAHLAFISKKMREEAKRSEAAALRLRNGTELTSTPTEKDFGRIVDFLLRSGVEMADAGDADGVTPLMLAAKHGLLFIMRRLLTERDGFKGCDALRTDAAGNSALHYARAFRQQAAAELIAEFLGDVEDVPNSAGLSPADVAGRGAALLPASAEALVLVQRLPKRSGTLPAIEN